MCADFLAARVRLCGLPKFNVQPFPDSTRMPGQCWKNVQNAIRDHGGTAAYGWALANVGPSPVSGCQQPRLYSRWVNHVLWRNTGGQLWEVTPAFNVLDQSEIWTPTIFASDDEATFDIANEESCSPQPAIYAALRPEGEWTSDCLCQAERAPREAQDLWLDRALLSIRQSGFQVQNWRVERVGDRIADVWLIA